MKGLAFLFLFALTSLFAIEGTYQVTGWDPTDKQPYAGTAVIKQVQGNIYKADWSFNNGTKFKGTGILDGNVAGFSFTETDEGCSKAMSGIQLYKVDGNTLQGSWVFSGQSELGTEKLIKK